LRPSAIDQGAKKARKNREEHALFHPDLVPKRKKSCQGGEKRAAMAAAKENPDRRSPPLSSFQPRPLHHFFLLLALSQLTPIPRSLLKSKPKKKKRT